MAIAVRRRSATYARQNAVGAWMMSVGGSRVGEAQPNFGSLTVFHFETPSPDELGEPCAEAKLVGAACALVGHRFHPFNPLGTRDLKAQLRYVFQWDTPATDKPEFSLHFSCHANRSGIQVGTADLDWKQFAKIIKDASDGTSVRYMMVISACGGGRSPDLRRAFEGLSNKPIYVFTYENKIAWADAALAASLLYRLLPKVPLDDKEKVKQIVKHVRALGFGHLVYYRRQGKSFNVYPKGRKRRRSSP